jgi:hypothetical protein
LLILVVVVQLLQGGGVFAAVGLHSLVFGIGADSNTLFMSAGLGNETRGMFLRLLPSPCPVV